MAFRQLLEVQAKVISHFSSVPALGPAGQVSHSPTARTTVTIGIAGVGAITGAGHTIVGTIARTTTGIVTTRTKTVCALTVDGKVIRSKTARTIGVTGRQ